MKYLFKHFLKIISLSCWESVEQGDWDDLYESLLRGGDDRAILLRLDTRHPH